LRAGPPGPSGPGGDGGVELQPAPCTRSTRSSRPPRRAPASRASDPSRPWRTPPTRTVLPMPCGSTTAPRTIWSGVLGIHPQPQGEIHRLVELRARQLLGMPIASSTPCAFSRSYTRARRLLSLGQGRHVVSGSSASSANVRRAMIAISGGLDMALLPRVRLRRTQHFHIRSPRLAAAAHPTTSIPMLRAVLRRSDRGTRWSRY